MKNLRVKLNLSEIQIGNNNRSINHILACNIHLANTDIDINIIIFKASPTRYKINMSVALLLEICGRHAIPFALFRKWQKYHSNDVVFVWKIYTLRLLQGLFCI